ncbi:MAG: tRNA (adenosine(37)-N6)-threonylcarbamoyltransferase complex ATPase subunit type 1 TsaE [Streptosporangiales bacterium]|nr:tRNA (adenosine(37)-N6)-threonylcarbamoyltransferase complex ATPase subunit type 1 TsaE [Streptosporangiales bacterium]
MNTPNGSSFPLTVEPAGTSEEMRALGRRLAAVLRAGDLAILSGPLGAGKTTLTQGIADGLGVRGPVTSPTFVIARVHPSLRSPVGPPLVHVDAYRLGSVLEMDDLDLDTDLATSVTVVEWGADRAEGLSESRLEIEIAPAPTDVIDGDSPRTVRVTGVGSRWQDTQLPHVDSGNRL